MPEKDVTASALVTDPEVMAHIRGAQSNQASASDMEAAIGSVTVATKEDLPPVDRDATVTEVAPQPALNDQEPPRGVLDTPDLWEHLQRHRIAIGPNFPSDQRHRLGAASNNPPATAGVPSDGLVESSDVSVPSLEPLRIEASSLNLAARNRGLVSVDKAHDPVIANDDAVPPRLEPMSSDSDSPLTDDNDETDDSVLSTEPTLPLDDDSRGSALDSTGNTYENRSSFIGHVLPGSVSAGEDTVFTSPRDPEPGFSDTDFLAGSSANSSDCLACWRSRFATCRDCDPMNGSPDRRKPTASPSVPAGTVTSPSLTRASRGDQPHLHLSSSTGAAESIGPPTGVALARSSSLPAQLPTRGINQSWS